MYRIIEQTQYNRTDLALSQENPVQSFCDSITHGSRRRFGFTSARIYNGFASPDIVSRAIGCDFEHDLHQG